MAGQQQLGFSLLVLFLWGIQGGIGQNLIPNPSFEDFEKCPSQLGQFGGNVKEWSLPTLGTTDLFHPCSVLTGIPENFNGEQEAAAGTAYAGFYAYAPRDYREYVQVGLWDELQKGVRYDLSFQVSLAETSDYALKSLGAVFAAAPLQINTKRNVSRTVLAKKHSGPSHSIYITSKEFIDNKKEWVTLRYTYEAQGWERYLIVGNSESNRGTQKKKVVPKVDRKIAYYYLDNVQLVPHWESLFVLNTSFVLPGLHFGFDSYALESGAYAGLDSLAAYLRQNKEVSLEVVGHTDAQGGDGYNQKLSRQRAEQVRRYLIIQGVDGDRIQCRGSGSKEPTADNATAIGRRENRRVAFFLTD